METHTEANFKRNYERYLQHLKLKGLQPKTIDAYSRAIRQAGERFGRQIDDLSAQQLADYFSERLASHSGSAVKLDLYGLRFYYEYVLAKPTPVSRRSVWRVRGCQVGRSRMGQGRQVMVCRTQGRHGEARTLEARRHARSARACNAAAGRVCRGTALPRVRAWRRSPHHGRPEAPHQRRRREVQRESRRRLLWRIPGRPPGRLHQEQQDRHRHEMEVQGVRSLSGAKGADAGRFGRQTTSAPGRASRCAGTRRATCCSENGRPRAGPAADALHAGQGHRTPAGRIHGQGRPDDLHSGHGRGRKTVDDAIHPGRWHEAVCKK